LLLLVALGDFATPLFHFICDFDFCSTVTSNAIVSSLFPEAVKKQLMESQATEHLFDDTLPKAKLKSFLNNGSQNDNPFGDERGESYDFADRNAKQIAELFPETTIMFADIAGFTAWASSREPSHVFTLLETLYGAFDRQAKRMGEFDDPDREQILVVLFSLLCMYATWLQESSK
jgi:hypothetical protein